MRLSLTQQSQLWSNSVALNVINLVITGDKRCVCQVRSFATLPFDSYK
jgi:hypothetical protein